MSEFGHIRPPVTTTEHHPVPEILCLPWNPIVACHMLDLGMERAGGIMSRTHSTDRTPYRDRHRVIALGIAMLILMIVSGSNLVGDARFIGTHDLLPPALSGAGTRIVGMIRDFGERASRVYRYTVSSASALSHIKRELEQSSVNSSFPPVSSS